MDQTTAVMTLLSSPRYSKRIEGLERLAAERRFAEIVTFALQESDRAVVAAACDLLFPEPPELLVHLFSLQKGADAPLEFRYRIPGGNYLYAERQLYDLFRPKLARLSVDYVDAFGLGYLRSFADALARYVRPSLRTYATAQSDGDAGVKPRRLIIASDGRDQWDGRSELTLSALIALRRLDHDIETSVLPTLGAAAESIDNEHLSLFASAAVEWVSFDVGVTDDSTKLEQLITRGAFEFVADYSTTLIKRGDESKLRTFLREVPTTYRVAGGFAFWPFTDFLESEGLIDSNAYGHHKTMALYSYRRARAMNVAPPPWYEWRRA
jgi:hypothetical protein